MTITGSEVKDPIPSASSGQALPQKTGEGWGTRSNHISFDPEFAVGARNAVNVCLRVQPDEKVCVITDEVTIEIAAAIVCELETLGAPYRAWAVEDLAERPLRTLPAQCGEDLESRQDSICAVQVEREELEFGM